MPRPFPASQWISFLRKYGPVPTNDNMYDEAIQRSLHRTNVSPIVLPSAYIDELIQNFRSDHPRSVVLTGTAGDGKTYHCREVYMALGGNLERWNEGHMEQRLALNQRQLVVVKDLSEMPERLRSKFVPVLAQDVLKENPRRLYLIAANHGQLLEQLDASTDHPAVLKFKEMVEEAMVTGASPPDALLMLYDMSKASALDVIYKVIDQVVLHTAWDACESCPLNSASPRCPIRENRARLLQDEPQGLLFRKRLAALIELSELNKIHFPIRQLLALVANMLLGHPEATDGLMTCRTASRILDEGTHDEASVYANVFGENLRRRGEKTEPFSKLRRFGIGEETNNGIDNILVYGRDDHKLNERFTELIGSDAVYGATPAYLAAQHAYVDGDNAVIKDFLNRLCRARERLFFVIPPESDAESLLWELTVFHYAGDFLSTAHKLSDGNRPERPLVSRLVRGLNRVFTGALVEDQQQVILASAGSHSQSRTSHIVDAFISVQRRLGEEVLLKWERGRILLSIHLAATMPPIELPLTLLRFEFLCRVAEGALPSSFSRECYEDLLDYKARLYRGLQKRQQAEQVAEEKDLILNFLELAPDGRVRQESVEVKVP